MKRAVLDNLKNIPGWRTPEKLVVFSVDDYGNVRLDSKSARDRIQAAGIKLNSRFDQYDALETRQDLEALFDVLTSVSDSVGRPAIFTPYTLCANIDFSAMLNSTDRYRYEVLPRTFERAAAEDSADYSGAWSLWQDGIRSDLMRPQFHGREHLNIEFLERMLGSGDAALKTCMKNKSLVALGEEVSMPGVGFTHAFGFLDLTSLVQHREILSDGLALFETVFGFRSTTFAPPALKLHPDLYQFVESLGIQGIDKPFRGTQKLGANKVKKEMNFLGRRVGSEHVSIVRNVVFEPANDPKLDSVRLALNQIEAAFRWHKPAIVSSHRVNYSGHIDPGNRKIGLGSLRRLLKSIVERWPDVQFISADNLVQKVLATT